MDKIRKFLLKLTKKERTILQKTLRDIRLLSIQNYDVKPLKGYKGLFRLRKGDIRIVFAKQKDVGVILDIDFRKDIYKSV